MADGTGRPSDSATVGKAGISDEVMMGLTPVLDRPCSKNGEMLVRNAVVGIAWI